jgi:hypothetical protein
MPKPNNENNASQLLAKAESMIQKANRDKNPYDAVWIFFDNDNQTNLSAFFQKQIRSNVQIAYSSICIEHWFIIHLQDVRQAYPNAQQALERLKTLWQNQFQQDYHKTKINHYERLKAFIPTAILRANQINRQANNQNIPLANRNPYFTIQEFIGFFQNL